MYSALIGAGISALSDLLRSQTTPSNSTSFPDPAEPSTDANSQAASVPGTTTSNPVGDPLHKLLLDLQTATTSTGATRIDPAGSPASSLAAYARTASVGASQTAPPSLTA